MGALRVLIVVVAVLASPVVAHAWRPLPNGQATVEMGYTEPSLNVDGTPLTDLAKIRAYYRTCLGANCVMSGSESIIDIPATRPQGGGVITGPNWNTSITANVRCQQVGTVAVRLTALDTGNTESASTAVVQGTINRTAEACPPPPPTVPRTPTGLGVQ